MVDISGLSERRKEIIVNYLFCDMNMAKTGRMMYMASSSIWRHIAEIAFITGKDPRNIKDLKELMEAIDYERTNNK